tara:strand:+ start:49591 stop:50532 length:942 start_codon:yes stop_codon:yes gene_type:complete
MSNCPLCHSKKTEVFTKQIRFDLDATIYKCTECTLTYLDQQSYNFSENFYETEYHQTYLTHIDPDILDPQIHYNKMIKASSFWIEKIKSLLTRNDNVLDVGCSTGHLLSSIRNSANNIAGSELNHKEIDFCKNVLSLDVSSKPLDERFEEKYFDVITLNFVLEHIGEPISFLKNLKRFLKDDGKIIIVVPNIHDPLLSLYNIDEFKKFYFCIEHLFYYSEKTLNDVMRKAGFKTEIECIQEYPISNHLNWIYNQKPSETLNARKISPHINIKEDNKQDLEKWENLWIDINSKYNAHLKNNGFTDRLWCIGKNE